MDKKQRDRVAPSSASLSESERHAVDGLLLLSQRPVHICQLCHDVCHSSGAHQLHLSSDQHQQAARQEAEAHEAACILVSMLRK